MCRQHFQTSATQVGYYLQTTTITFDGKVRHFIVSFYTIYEVDIEEVAVAVAVASYKDWRCNMPVDQGNDIGRRSFAAAVVAA